ncbi:MAG: RHS repeat-associated core domain-containing protein [Bosea sp. (in: a-proteobacteria)]
MGSNPTLSAMSQIATGATLRETIYLQTGEAGAMPLAAIDAAASPKKLYAVHVDHLNRPIMLTDAAKINVWWASYEPFGKVRATGGALTQNLGLPGQWFQLESGLAYNWHRHYDPATGRYTTADPLGFVDGASVFAYASSAPQVAVDPSGQFVHVIIGVGLGIVADLAISKVRDNCACKDTSSAVGAAGYGALGGIAGATGPYARKPRTGIGGGGPSGPSTSVFSSAVGSGYKGGYYSIGTRNTLRAFGDLAGRRLVPGLGIGLTAYELYRLKDCF